MFKYFVKKQYSDEENPYWISFSDAVSGLLIIFILIMVNLHERISNIDKELNQKITKNLEEIKRDLSQKGIYVEVDKNIMSLPTDAIEFDSGKSNIPTNKIKMVQDIGKEVINKFKNDRNIDTIFIEGHTDCQYYGAQRGNLGLSTDRAISVANIWASDEVEPNFWKLKNKDGKPLFSVSGYGEHRPIKKSLNGICTNDEKINKPNRRIDVRFVTKTQINGTTDE